VFWAYYEGNDLDDLQGQEAVIDEHFLLNYLHNGFSQHLIARQDEIDKAIIDDIPRLTALEKARVSMRKANAARVFPRLLEFGKFSELRTRLHLVGGNSTAEEEKLQNAMGPTMDLFARILEQARNDVNAWGGQLYFVYLPAWARYGNRSALLTSYSSDSLGLAMRSRVLLTARNLGLPVIDIHPAFQRYHDPSSLFPFRMNGHYNETGHSIVATEILKVIHNRTS
jgi:hypothetical protein